MVSVLVVDDEEPIRNALRKFLKQQQFEVYAAGSGDEALQQLRLHKVSLMLSDIRMPGISGVDLVPQALEIEPDLAILMLTAVNDATSAALCMQRGAMDYLTKPIELADLGRAVQRALKRREMLLENRELNQWLKEEVTTRTAELQRERHRLERVSTATLEALVNALEAKDPYLRGHSARVADFSANIAAELALPEEDVERVRMAGRLHDLGKIGRASPIRKGRSRPKNSSTSSNTSSLARRSSPRSPTWATSCRWCAVTTSAGMAPATRRACAARRSRSVGASSRPPRSTMRLRRRAPTRTR